MPTPEQPTILLSDLHELGHDVPDLRITQPELNGLGRRVLLTATNNLSLGAGFGEVQRERGNILLDDTACLIAAMALTTISSAAGTGRPLKRPDNPALRLGLETVILDTRLNDRYQERHRAGLFSNLPFVDYVNGVPLLDEDAAGMDFSYAYEAGEPQLLLTERERRQLADRFTESVDADFRYIQAWDGYMATMQDKAADPNVQNVIDETLKFLFTSAKTNKSLAACMLVDVVWHEMILDTAFYRELCLRRFGGYVLHHKPNFVNDPSKKVAHLVSTQRVMSEVGMKADEKVWATSAACGSCAPPGSCRHEGLTDSDADGFSD